MDFLRLIIFGAVVYFLFGFLAAVIGLIGLVFLIFLFAGHYERDCDEYMRQVKKDREELLKSISSF